MLSAIAQPNSSFENKPLHPTLYDKSAAYLFHLCQNHPFIDGNKRVAAVSALAFLAMNDAPYDYSESALEALVRSIAEGKSGKKEASLFLSNPLG